MNFFHYWMVEDKMELKIEFCKQALKFLRHPLSSKSFSLPFFPSSLFLSLFPLPLPLSSLLSLSLLSLFPSSLSLSLSLSPSPSLLKMVACFYFGMETHGVFCCCCYLMDILIKNWVLPLAPILRYLFFIWAHMPLTFPILKFCVISLSSLLGALQTSVKPQLFVCV